MPGQRINRERIPACLPPPTIRTGPFRPAPALCLTLPDSPAPISRYDLSYRELNAPSPLASVLARYASFRCPTGNVALMLPNIPRRSLRTAVR